MSYTPKLVDVLKVDQFKEMDVPGLEPGCLIPFRLVSTSLVLIYKTLTSLILNVQEFRNNYNAVLFIPLFSNSILAVNVTIYSENL